MTEPVVHSRPSSSSTLPHKSEVPAPSPAVRKILREAIDAHVSAYIRNGGSRHFPTENAQDEARGWLDMVDRMADRA